MVTRVLDAYASDEELPASRMVKKVALSPAVQRIVEARAAMGMATAGKRLLGTDWPEPAARRLTLFGEDVQIAHVNYSFLDRFGEQSVTKLVLEHLSIQQCGRQSSPPLECRG